MITNIFSRHRYLWIGMAFLLILNILRPARAEPALPETSQAAIDAYIDAQMRELEIPGLAVAIVKDNQVAHVRGYGVADDTGRQVTAQTPFLIASMSKSITALAVMQLVEAGKLQLDAPVQEYLPWFRVADPEASSKITIRHLLNQTSGFSELEGYKRNLERDSSAEALEASVRRLNKSRLNAAPGERFEYSNTNYDILGLLIQTVSGASYENYIEQRIFAPLNMRNSFTSLNEARAGGMSGGFTPIFGATIAYDRYMPYSHTVVPSAGLFASAEDMAQYLIAHLNEGLNPEGARVLSQTGMAQLHTPGIKINEQVGYAMGLTSFPFPEAATSDSKVGSIPTGLAHGGAWANFKSTMLIIPEHRLGVVVLMNKNDYQKDTAYDNICWNTALIALGLQPSISQPEANSFLQDERFPLAVVLLFLLVSFVWSIRKIRQLSMQQVIEAQHRRKLISQIILLALVDLILAGGLLFIKLPQDINTLALAVRFTPDIGLMYVIILGLTLGWGLLRTILFVPHLSRASTATRIAA